MKVKDRKIIDLIDAEYNPRQLTEKQYDDLEESIQKFGFVDPVIVNVNKDRLNVVIGGHQRIKIAKKMGFNKIPCVELDLNWDQERELNVRLNKNTGEWDWDVLANNFDVKELVDWGFDEKTFSNYLDMPKDETPEYELSKEILEEHNYVVFTFDNSLDWNVAQDLLDIREVAKPNYTDTYVQKGLGRVKDGKKLLKLLDGLGKIRKSYDVPV